MLGDAVLYATIAVKDLSAGKHFYGDTLGLKQVDENPGGVTFASGTGKLFMYESPNAGTNQATCAAFDVTDINAVVNELKGKGVVFEHYDDMPETTREGDIHIMGPMKAAWFKDPDGNILSIDQSA